MNERNKVKVLIEHLDLEFFEGIIDDVIDRLNLLIAGQAEKYNELFIVREGGWSDDPPQLYLYGERLENDVEFDRRLKMEEKLKKQKKENAKKTREMERAEYERLKKKFEKKK